MLDSFGRQIDYLRVSITDRCNLRCAHCMPHDLPSIAHDDILRYEEILRVCTVAAKLGVRTIKVTGGEPLTRRGCVEFIRKLKAVPGIENVTMTTNAVLLEQYLDELVELKLDGINVSLHNLDPESYSQFTGRDEFHNVWQAITKAVEAGLRVKVNCVPVAGKNEKEIIPLAKLAEKMPLNVRFIELMPSATNGNLEGFMSKDIINTLLKEYPELTPDLAKRGFGPARYFTSPGLKGSIGVIDAMSNHFCNACNRFRLTSTGFLKLCLHHGDGLDLRQMLRSGASDEIIEAAIEKAVFEKPDRHYFGKDIAGQIKMSQIGG